MQNLVGIKPEAVLHYFEEICAIPHGSYHIDEISNYLVDFAKTYGLRYVQDDYKNVVIYKAATPGYEKEPTIIIQGHMDMVAVHNDSSIDMNTTAISIKREGTFLYAKDSSLGADDGIAIAYALAVLSSKEYHHPALEIVITTNEEVGMDGAMGLDEGLLSGTRVLNIDSEEEGVFTVGCAGGVRVEATLPLHSVKHKGNPFRIEISGLQGGHSGTMIHLHRANACCLLGRFLKRLFRITAFQIVTIGGGVKCNAIPDCARADILLTDNDLNQFMETCEQLEKEFQNEYSNSDPQLSIKVTNEAPDEIECFSKEDTEKIIALLCNEPDGVIAMSQKVQGLVETSLNLGILEQKEKQLHTCYELRSCVRNSISQLRDRVIKIAEEIGATTTQSAAYPEWEYREDSPLLQKMRKVYRNMYNKEPEVTIVHAGLECGVLAEKMRDFDGVSFGPDIFDIHTTKEHLDLVSVERVWNLLLEILATKDEQI